MSGNRENPDGPVAPEVQIDPDAAAASPVPEPPRALPSGRIPTIGMRELVAALHRRRARRRESASELRHALVVLSAGVEKHLARIAELRSAVEAQGGNLESLQYYDNVMARLRNELRSAERALAEAFHAAAGGDAAPAI